MSDNIFLFLKIKKIIFKNNSQINSLYDLKLNEFSMLCYMVELDFLFYLKKIYLFSYIKFTFLLHLTPFFFF